mgnify:CR=1 FL=1
MADDITVSGTSDPYAVGYYSPGSNSKNTLTIESYFKLLAAQLANQDMTSPMSNSEMMAQMTNMAMVQSLTAMTDSIRNSTAVSTQTYAASMIGQEITVAVVDEKTGKPTGVKYGKVASVDFTQGTPVIKLEGDDTEYPMAYILGVGKIPDPYAPEPENPDEKPEHLPTEPDDPNKPEHLPSLPEESEKVKEGWIMGRV